ncbi:MAG: hypothetical protein ACSLEX_04445 [Minisyncoccota bacterium]
MSKIIVLSIDPWKFVDEKTGEEKSGISLWFLNSYRDPSLGLKPSKISIAPEKTQGLGGKLPALAEVEFGSRPGLQNRATLQLDSIKLLSPVDFSRIFGGSPAVNPA